MVHVLEFFRYYLCNTLNNPHDTLNKYIIIKSTNSTKQSYCHFFNADDSVSSKDQLFVSGQKEFGQIKK